jgi:hypothetical protein
MTGRKAGRSDRSRGRVGGGGDREIEGRQEHMDATAKFVDAVERAGGAGGGAGDVVAVVGKLFAGREARGFADDFLAFDDEMGAVEVLDHPFAAEERERVFGAVVNRDEVDEGVRLIGGQTRATVMVDEFVQSGGEAGGSG